MLSKWFFNKKIFLLKGTSLVELMVTLTISAAIFLGLAIFYTDIVKNHAQEQIIEEIQFNLSRSIDYIVNDMKMADSIYINGDDIFVMEINQDGSVSTPLHYYSYENNEGILYDDEPITHLPGYHLFDENNGIYYVTIEEFNIHKDEDLDIINTRSKRLKDNYYQLIVEFNLYSNNDINFQKEYKFERDIFTLIFSN